MGDYRQTRNRPVKFTDRVALHWAQLTLPLNFVNRPVGRFILRFGSAESRGRGRSVPRLPGKSGHPSLSCYRFRISPGTNAQPRPAVPAETR